MTIYAIADLHLSDGDKPMDVFGAQWADHDTRIREDWKQRVTEEDIVLLPGDFSWAMQLQDAKRHMAFLADLPGRKVLIRGNHDYWWGSISRVREALPACCYALQNDAILLDGILLCGTRGWLLPNESQAADDKKIYAREVMRLEASCKAARKLSEDAPLIVMTHFPPLSEALQDTEFTRIIEQYGAKNAVYGHLHGPALKGAFRGEKNGVYYHNVSCDGLQFKLKEILL